MTATPEKKRANANRIHSLPVHEIGEALDTRAEGLTSAQAGERLVRFGPNSIREAPKKPLLIRFLANFTHLMALLLWVGGAIGFISGTPELGVAIWMVNVINGLFSFWQEFKAEKATDALRRLLPTYARVIRDGTEQRVLAEQLVPGDVVLLAEGDHISSDARLIMEAELQVDQSALTGESNPVRKTSEAILEERATRAELANLVFAGTSVASGTGKAVIFATGMDTEFGKIAHLTQNVAEEPSPLQKELSRVTKIVSFIATGIGAAFFLLAVLVTRMSPAKGFIFAMGMIVAFVPEGMLPTVTLSLAMGVQRMARRHALVKKLSAVETLGSTSVICTDKTGTLTKNEMTVREIWLPQRPLVVAGVGYEPEGRIEEEGKPVETAGDLGLLLTAAALNNNSRLIPPEKPDGRWAILGDPTEAALLTAARKAGLDLEAAARKEPRLRELPFESRRKRMTTIHRNGTRRVAYVKGAPKEVLALCTRLRSHGGETPLDDSMRATITEANDTYARAGLRVLAFASREIPAGFADYRPETVEMDLTFLGLMGMIDPPRPEVSAAVEKCHHAGIRVIMVTGDYGLTAESIARRIGIVHESPRTLSGAEIDAMSDEDLKQALKGEVIFARVAPEHKMRVVSAFRELGNVVAVTGDGVNDAPALKRADIGIAMGITGTDVAKEAADMILSDDNFASIVNAVEEGRAVYGNIKKFISYIFTSNTPESIPFIFFALSGGRFPLALNVMQVLSVDLGTDMLPALALGAESPEPGIMDSPPRSLKEHLITGRLLKRAFLYLGLVQSFVAVLAFLLQYWTHGYAGQLLGLPTAGLLYRSATTMTLAAIVTTQIGNLFAQRSEFRPVLRSGVPRNRLIWIGILAELTLVFLLQYTPFLQGIFGTAPFPIVNWVFLLALIPLLPLVDDWRKSLRRSERKGRG